MRSAVGFTKSPVETAYVIAGQQQQQPQQQRQTQTDQQQNQQQQRQQNQEHAVRMAESEARDRTEAVEAMEREMIQIVQSGKRIIDEESGDSVEDSVGGSERGSPREALSMISNPEMEHSPIVTHAAMLSSDSTLEGDSELNLSRLEKELGRNAISCNNDNDNDNSKRNWEET